MREVFLSEYEYSIDKQRRVAVPREWREESDTPDVFYLIPGRENTVQVLTQEYFMTHVLPKLKKISFVDKKRRLSRLGRFAHECVCDKHNRISLPPLHVKHAKLELGGQVHISGTVNGFEIRRVDEAEVLEESIEEFLDDLEDITSEDDGE